MPPRPRPTPSAEPLPPPYQHVQTTGRYAVEGVSPVLEHGRPVKAVVGESLAIGATILGEGHDRVGATVVLSDPGGAEHTRAIMIPESIGTDRRTAQVRPDAIGVWSYRVEAWGDPIATWRHRALVKIAADIDVDLELEEGARLHDQALKLLPRGKVRMPLKDAIAALRDTTIKPAQRLSAAISNSVVELLDRFPLRLHVTSSLPHPIRVDRERALVGAWYEMFPRSEGAVPPVSGTFITAAERLPAIAAMGFDVVYLPPVHPIGRAFRKGPNNTLIAGPDDPGSPWAIGSIEGGHDALHPELGSWSDFGDFIARAGELGMEVALDLALQCSPDHPWVSEHPDWFVHRADGSIAYAENPPKKYQDIYPMYFQNDPEGIHAEALRVVQLWMSCGVKIFRVDNPHTKPAAFWERLIGEINHTDPDVLFLAEAFTRPALMRLLGEVGFHQSYTYFTWRNDKWEIQEYLRELSGPLAASMRPNFFTNTPDILSDYLQYGGPPAFAIRAVLAATLSPSYGIYAGFELYEHVAVRPGSEEYLDSEKYQFRPRDWSVDPDRTLSPWLTSLNTWRRQHPALQRLRNLQFHETDDDKIIAYSKREGEDTIIMVVNLDPYGARETVVSLDLLGLQLPDKFTVHDLVTDATWVWGERNYVRLDPVHNVAHVLHVTPTEEPA